MIRSVSVICATYGSLEWADLAHERALPSAHREVEKAGGDSSVCHIHLHDGTLAQARNQAAQDVTGEWLCFLDADDELAPGYLEALANGYGERATWDDLILYHPALLVPAVSFIDPATGIPTAAPRVPNGGCTYDLIDINCAVIGTMIERAFFLSLGGFRELDHLEDWDLWLRAEEAGARLVPIRDAVYRAWLRYGSRNTDQSLYHRIRDEAIARRATSAGTGSSPG